MEKLVLSDKTLKVIKSFGHINPGMVFRPGKNLEIAHPLKTTLGVFHSDSQIPAKFAIADVNKFLGVIGLHDKESLDINIDPDQNVLYIKSKTAKTKYRTTDPTNVIHLPENFEDIMVGHMAHELGTFSLTAEEVEKIKGVSNALSLPHVIFECDPTNHLLISLKDVEDDSKDMHDILSDGDATGDFKNLTLLTAYLANVIPNDYAVIATKNVIHFKAKDGSIEYYLSLENKEK